MIATHVRHRSHRADRRAASRARAARRAAGRPARRRRRRASPSRASPGIGKTRLLAELRRRAEDRGHVVLSGAAAEFERDLPYGVWVEALDAYVASQELARRRSCLVGADLALASCPRCGGARPTAARRRAPPRAPRDAAAAGVLAERSRSCSCSTTCTGATPASVELHRRARAPRHAAPACCSRSATAPAARPRRWRRRSPPGGAGDRAGSARARSECRALAGDELAGGAAHRDLPRERRQPVLRAAARRAPRARRRAARRRTAWRPTAASRARSRPRCWRSSTRSRPDARRLLDAGAVAGDPFEPELAFAIAELTRRTRAWPRWTSCSTRGSLQPTAVPRRFAFRHPLVRRAVYESARRRLAARRARPRGGGAGRARRGRGVPRAPRRAVRGAGRRGRDRAAARGRRRRPRRARPRPPRAGSTPRCACCRSADQRGPRAARWSASRRCCARPATGACARGCSRRSTLVPDERDPTAGRADRGLRGRRALPRPPRAGDAAARRRARRRSPDRTSRRPSPSLLALGRRRVLHARRRRGLRARPRRRSPSADALGDPS